MKLESIGYRQSKGGREHEIWGATPGMESRRGVLGGTRANFASNFRYTVKADKMPQRVEERKASPQTQFMIQTRTVESYRPISLWKRKYQNPN